MSDSNKVLATYFAENDAIKPEWKNEEEKGLFWFYDDLHCPNPISPLYFTCNGWWGPTCEYMYRRFGAPIGSEWLGKRIGGYVYTAVVPPKTKAEQVGGLFTYYMSVMPEYARTFYERWRTEYIPEIKSYWNKILDFDFENSTIPQALIHMEDCLDMQERAFKIHWIINLAQFKASSDFVDYYAELFGGVDNEVGKINVSTDDRNWDSLRELWKMKEFVKNRPALKKLFDENEKEVIVKKLDETEDGKKFKDMLNDYRKEYGFHALYTHEYIFKTIYEDPTPILDTIKDYLNSDYNFNDHYRLDEQGVFADYVVIMGYDEHYAGSQEPGSVASIGYVTYGIEEALKHVGKEKLINGIPFYTRVWKTTAEGVSSQAYGMNEVQTFIANHGMTVEWNASTEQNYAEVHEDDATYQIWIEDAESIERKLEVMQNHSIAGVAQWCLGMESSDVWDVIADYMEK